MRAYTSLCCGMIAALGLLGVRVKGDYELSWWTSDAGGDMWTTGGGYELSGTIGQPDAGVMTGGDYELTGGFWFSAAAAPAICRGDSNCDHVVSWRDIDYFVAAQNDSQSSWYKKFLPGTPRCSFWVNDVNNDNHVSWRDITPFVSRMNTTCP